MFKRFGLLLMVTVILLVNASCFFGIPSLNFINQASNPGDVFFVSDRGQEEFAADIYTMGLDGSNARSIPSTQYPKFSVASDYVGNNLAFVDFNSEEPVSLPERLLRGEKPKQSEFSRLMLMNQDGSDITELMASSQPSQKGSSDQVWPWSAQISGDGQKVAFLVVDPEAIDAQKDLLGSVFDVMGINADGSDLHYINQEPRSFEFDVALNYDGSKAAYCSIYDDFFVPQGKTDLPPVAFLSDRGEFGGIYQKDWDGSNRQLLVAFDTQIFPYSVTYSPDRRHLAFIAANFEEEIFEVNVMDPEHPELGYQTVFSSPNYFMTQLRYSTDGSKLLFNALYNDEPLDMQEFVKSRILKTPLPRTLAVNIFSINPSGPAQQTPQNLTDNEFNNYFSYPLFQFVFFTGNAARFDFYRPEVYLMNNNGSNQQRLGSTDYPKLSVSYAPSACRVALVDYPGYDENNESEGNLLNKSNRLSNTRLVIFNTATSEEAVLEEQYELNSCAISRDGERIAYMVYNEDDEHYEIYANTAYGYDRHVIAPYGPELAAKTQREYYPDEDQDAAIPDINADGSSIVYSIWNDDVYEHGGIYLNNWAGNNAVQLEANADDESTENFYPVFSPDGNQVAFVTYTYDEEWDLLSSQVRILDLRNRQAAVVYETEDDIGDLRYSLDGNFLFISKPAYFGETDSYSRQGRRAERLQTRAFNRDGEAIQIYSLDPQGTPDQTPVQLTSGTDNNFFNIWYWWD